MQPPHVDAAGAPLPGGPPLRRELTLTDLPTDVLAHILSFVPFVDRFRYAAKACRDLAAAARPPSAAWTNLSLKNTDDWSPYSYGLFFATFLRAATAVRRLEAGTRQNNINVLISLATVAMPYLESLTLMTDPGVDHEGQAPFDHVGAILYGLQWTSATRFTHLNLRPYVQVYAPPGGLPGAAWKAAADALADVFVPEDGDDFIVATDVAEAAAPVARLARFSCGYSTFERVDAFVAVAHQSLTHLRVGLHPDFLPGGWTGTPGPNLASLVNQLGSLKELAIDVEELHDVPTHNVDLSSIDSTQFLTRLALGADLLGDVRLSDAQAGRLRDLTLRNLASADPPALMQGDRFGCLTRLKYCHDLRKSPANLGPWADVNVIHIPTLVGLDVEARLFTLDGQDGEAWAAAVAGVSLPELSALVLRWSARDTAQYACRAVPGVREGQSPTHCPACGAEGECEGGRAARRAMTDLLPAAYARRGRALRLACVFTDEDGGEESIVEMHFEAAPPE